MAEVFPDRRLFGSISDDLCLRKGRGRKAEGMMGCNSYFRVVTFNMTFSVFLFLLLLGLERVETLFCRLQELVF